MLELNFSRSNKSTMLREEIVSVSIVEIKLEQVMSAREKEKRSWHLRLERIHIEKAVIELHRWEFLRRGQHRIRIPLDGSLVRCSCLAQVRRDILLYEGPNLLDFGTWLRATHLISAP